MERINGTIFKQMLESGANNLMNQYARIDALNVFPVPDGDTGTNMSLTFSAGVNDALKIQSDCISDVAKALSKGLLMGARGNSGVITSQIFRGVYQSVNGNDEINALQLANAFVNGSRVAYKAVMRPVEGTILTVIREASDYTLLYAADNAETITCIDVMEKLVAEAKESLDRTPDLLPVLKEVGVVDSGGAGLLVILEGCLSALKGEAIAKDENAAATTTVATEIESDEFGYCTEFIIRLDPNKLATFKEEKLRDKLAKLGNSLVVVQDEEIVKVHVHTLRPGDALNIGQRYGEFVKLKIENMQEQHENIIMNESVNKEEPQIASKYAMIAVAAGDGLAEMFKELRVDHIISGGQTMNPSTEDFVEAIKKINAEHIFIMPNNSNIVLAAQQAAQVMEDRDIHVIPSKTIPQGLCACMMFNPEIDVESNVSEMMEGIANVTTGQVTYAIKDTMFDGMEIKEGDYMGIKEKDIVVSTSDKMEATKKLIDSLINGDSEIVTLIGGDNTTEDDLAAVTSYIEDNYEVEVEATMGGQPVYSYIIGVE